MNSYNNNKLDTIEPGELNDLCETLRKNLFLLLAQVDELSASQTEAPKIDVDFDKLTSLAKELDEIQKAGDNLIALMSPAQRKYLKHNLADFLSMFGWGENIDDNGRIIHNA